MFESLSYDQLPLWLKISYTLFICILIPIYWRRYGPGNFLWFSDIALVTTAATLWLESSLLTSTMALSVVILETVWIVDFLIGLFAGSSVVGLSAYRARLDRVTRFLFPHAAIGKHQLGPRLRLWQPSELAPRPPLRVALNARFSARTLSTQALPAQEAL